MSMTSNTGTCNLCEGVFSQKEILKHVRDCATSKCAGQKQEKMFLVNVNSSGFWLYIAASENAKLSDLDSFLRRIWLECCGHLSAFRIGGSSYQSGTSDVTSSKSMNFILKDVLHPGTRFEHEYDFGSTTYLALAVEDFIQLPADKSRILLLSRNNMQDIPCGVCGKKATQICVFCFGNKSNCFCEKCSEGHDCGEDGLLPIVNSPRCGVCGYTG
ncbi:MAG: hypothetical protein A2X48_22200 [Lentisphaerae bacterium GWF2_49_21]|nr:MAG: hypothetical protein A2X48_22200 [Lentisphaerae bacterium GWF2_49_21]